MLHIATVHFKSLRWAETQAQRLWARQAGPLAPLARAIKRRYRAWKTATVERSQQQLQLIFEQIQRDDPDWVGGLRDDPAAEPSHSPSA